MSDNREFGFRVRESERPDRYLKITSHLRKASIANLYHDEDAEREEVAMAHDLLSEVMGR
jgi:hypothetical protein